MTQAQNTQTRSGLDPQNKTLQDILWRIQQVAFRAKNYQEPCTADDLRGFARDIANDCGECGAQKKLSTVLTRIDKAYSGTMHAVEHTCLLKEFSLTAEPHSQAASLLYSSLSVLESYLSTIRDDLDHLMTFVKAAQDLPEEVHHD